MNKITFVKFSLLAILGFSLVSCEKFKKNTSIEGQKETTGSQQKSVTVPTYKDIKIPDVIVTELGKGQGEAATAESTVLIYYTMWIYDPAKPENKGEKIAEIVKPSAAQEVSLSKNDVVEGFKKGLIGMKPASKRRLIIPTELGYGAAGFGNVPGNAILMVEVTLEKIK